MIKITACSENYRTVFQITVTVFLLLMSLLVFETTNIDIWLQNYFYNFNTHSWIVDRNEAVTKFILYDGIKAAYLILALVVLASILFFRKFNIVQQYQGGLLILLLCMICIPLLVGWLKSITHVPCPNNLAIFNGSYPLVTIFSAYPADFHQSRNVLCFPAGHASGGFALLSLFFLFKRRKNRITALVSVLILGWSVGLYKMLIGDHFLSHTITSMLLAWLLCLIIAWSVNYFSREKWSMSGFYKACSFPGEK